MKITIATISFVAAVLISECAAQTTDLCKPKGCKEIYKPVCDSNGKTHANLCEFKNYQCLHPGVVLKHDGICTAEDCGDRICTMEWDPVCDSNGMIHSNLCVFEGYQCSHPDVTLAPDGECPQITTDE